MILSKLSEKCSNCRYKNNCDHKQMEASSYLEPAAMICTEPASMPALRETTEVYVHGIGKVSVYKDEIEKQLYKELSIGIDISMKSSTQKRKR